MARIDQHEHLIDRCPDPFCGCSYDNCSCHFDGSYTDNDLCTCACHDDEFDIDND